MPSPNPSSPQVSRRRFVQSTAALTTLQMLGGLPNVFAAGSDVIKVGIVGCGRRARNAVRNITAADPSVRIHALGDLFGDMIDDTIKEFHEGRDGPAPNNPIPRHQMAFTKERCFTGFDACQQVLRSGIDIVILSTPPAFRPEHTQLAVDAGVHIFAEKPIAVDPAGVRRFLAAAEAAKKKNLALVAGTQRRHSRDYIETMARIHDGAIGELTGGQCYWMQGGLWHRGRKPEWSEMEYQIRNWPYFTWISGDHIVEQHMHNIDVMNWVFGGPPVKAIGMGGRQARTDPKYGDVWDHFSVEFEYANGARVQSMCRQIPGTSGRVGERVTGTLGSADPAGSIKGPRAWEFSGEVRDGREQEHVNLIASIRAGRPINDGQRIADSTLTAIMGRMSAYTGRELSYNWVLNSSTLDLRPTKIELGPAPEPVVAVPGKTRLT